MQIRENTNTQDEELSSEELELFGTGTIANETDEDSAEQVDEEKEPDPETEPEPETETETETETEPETAKVTGRENWELDDYKKAYENLESKLGKQGAELGEARKKEAEPSNKVYTIDDVPTMEDEVLESYINAYDTELSDPALEFDDIERFNTLRKEYEVLKEERAIRKAMSRMQQKEALKSVDNVKTDVKKLYNLSEEETAQVVALAKRLSDEGIPTKEDLEAAVYRIKPAAVEAAITKKLNARISDAKTKGTPRVPSGSSHEAPKTISAKEFSKMDDITRERYLNDCSVDEVDRLLAEIEK